MAIEATNPDDLPLDGAAAPATGSRRRVRPRLRLKAFVLGMLVFIRDWGALPLCALLGLGAALTYVQASGYIMPIFDDDFGNA